MTEATWRDYSWVGIEFPGWVETGYGLSLVRNIGPEKLLDLLEADQRRITTVGVEGPGSLAADWEHGIDRAVGVATVSDEWCILAECHSGWVYADRNKVAPVAAEHEWVAHGTNFNAASRFLWWHDGVLRSAFEPGMVYDTDQEVALGAQQPGQLSEVVESVGGIRLDEDDRRGDFRAASFALAERISGVPLTAEQLKSIELLTASVDH